MTESEIAKIVALAALVVHARSEGWGSSKPLQA